MLDFMPMGSFWDEPLSHQQIGILLMVIGVVVGLGLCVFWEKVHRIGKLGRLSNMLGKEPARIVVVLLNLALVVFGALFAYGVFAK